MEIKEKQFFSVRENIAEKIDKIKKIIQREGPLLSTFSGDSSLKYTPSLEASTFSFHPEKYEIQIPIKWFLEKGYSLGEVRWALYHELSHFIDMRQDPESFLDNFEYMRSGLANQKISSWLKEKLKKDGVSQKVFDKLTKEVDIKDGKGTKMSALQKMAYDYLHTQYNVLDDIVMNNLIKQKVPRYSGEEGKREVENIYQNRLNFKDGDYKSRPRHVQFIYSLIRDEMLPNLEKSVLDKEIDEVVNKKKNYGKTIKEIIDNQFKPKAGNLLKAKKRYEIIKRLIEPAYLQLLKKDIEEIDFKKIEEELEKTKAQTDAQQQEGKEGQQEDEGEGEGENKEKEKEKKDKKEGEQGGQEGMEKGEEKQQEAEKQENGEDQKGKEQGNVGSGKANAGDVSDFDPFKEYHKKSNDSENIIPEEEIEKILEKFIEEKKINEMTPKERAEYMQERDIKEFDEKYGISSETRELFEEVSNKIKRSRQEMRDFWKKLIGKSIELERKKVRSQKKGEPNVDDFINEYPNVVEGLKTGKLSELTIYEKIMSIMKEVSKPERIEVSLVIDMSGSMNDISKIESLQKTVALLLLSLKDFNSYLDKTRRETKTKLKVYSEVYIFNDIFSRIKRFEDELGNKGNETAEIIKIFSSLREKNATGSTVNHPVLEAIVRSTNNEKVAKILKGKVKKIVFEITDGQPNSDSIEFTKVEIKKMLEKGIIPIAFQIGNVGEKEKDTFNEVWNKLIKNLKLGKFIGTDLDKLPKSLTQALKDKFGNIRL